MSHMKAHEFFNHALHATTDYDSAVVLTLLAVQGAAECAVRSSLTRLTSETKGCLTRSQAWRATNRLCAMGLLKLRVHPRTWTEYQMDQAAIGELLRRAADRRQWLELVLNQPVRLPAADDTAGPKGGERDVSAADSTSTDPFPHGSALSTNQ